MTAMYKTQEHPLMVEATAHVFTMPDGKVYEFVNIDGTDRYSLTGSSNYFDADQFARATDNAKTKGAEVTMFTGWTYK